MLTKERICNPLEGRSSCMNRVHDFANIVVPAIIDGLRQGFRLTNGSQFYQKDKDRLQAILNNYARRGHLSRGHDGCKGSSAWLRSDEYNVTLEITDNYPDKYHNDGSGGYSCTYYKRTVYLWNHKDSKAGDFKELPMTSLPEMEAASRRLKQIETEISELQSERYPLKRLIGE